MLRDGYWNEKQIGPSPLSAMPENTTALEHVLQSPKRHSPAYFLTWTPQAYYIMAQNLQKGPTTQLFFYTRLGCHVWQKSTPASLRQASQVTMTAAATRRLLFASFDQVCEGGSLGISTPNYGALLHSRNNCALSHRRQSKQLQQLCQMMYVLVTNKSLLHSNTLVSGTEAPH